ncbi:MBL fold metallo-hydrolase [Leptospira ryugenii]|uniref:MBL fold metallo-hydrolase n=1 Tax=Leptospira ryugenii TaxID=1917863 RepID=UPI000D59BBD5|nr:MBL fold metallo-hydrolase [Leptospira ryugenii]
MVVQLFGVRGSIAAPLRNQEYKKKILEALSLYQESGKGQSPEQFWKSLPYHVKFVTGSDTTCIKLTDHQGNLYIIDMGTGIRNVGDELIQDYLKSPGPRTVHIFVTHTHWDHIQGLPFFKPIYFPDFTLKFYSPYSDLQARLERQQNPEFFPVTFSSVACQKEFKYFSPGDVLRFGSGIEVKCYPLRHPGGSFAYRFVTAEGKTFIFATDAEFTGQDMEIIHDSMDFFQGADLLILDAQYTLDESFSKFDWGHTSYTMAVNCATSWNVKNLVLTHHEPTYTDQKIHEIFEAAVDHKDLLGAKNLKIHLAREGLRFHL